MVYPEMIEKLLIVRHSADDDVGLLSHLERTQALRTPDGRGRIERERP